jgi:hypothetical protein
MIHQSHSRASAWLARYLLQAMGLGAAATSLGAGACGGKVVVDTNHDTEGVGGADTTTGETSTSTTGTGDTGGFTCDTPVPAGQELVYACMTTPQGEGCPPKDSFLVMEDLGAQIDMVPGCGSKQVASIACGPDPDGAGCCYNAAVTTLLCGGRPFVVHGAARTAEIAVRSDWRAAISPDLTGLDEVDRAALAAGWAKEALDEHASVASFARFALELLAVGAPAELVLAAQRAMGQEVRHAELCFGLASAYAGADVGPSVLPTEGALGGRTTLAEVAAAVVREGCVGETIAAFSAMAARDASVDPAVRAALTEIVRDEVEHAALAWRFVAWAITQGDQAAIDATERALDAALDVTVELGEDGAADTAARRVSRARAHGRLPAAEQRAALAEALREVVRPSAEALLAQVHAARPQHADA